MKSLRTTLFAAAMVAAVAGIACSKEAKVAEPPAPAPEKQEEVKEAEVTRATPHDGRIEIEVTAKGFEPKNLQVKQGEPVTLVLTRTTEQTCATEILIEGTEINQPLPLNEAVAVTFTPEKSGALKYGCAMGKMIGGVILVQ